MRYDIGRDSNIYLCGLNSRCDEFEANLKRYGYRHIEKGDSSLKNLHLEIDEYVYIITLQNALRHEMIARILYEKGARRIVYLPLDSGSESGKLRRIYNDYLYGNCSLGADIEEYVDCSTEIPQVSDSVISEDGDFITLMVDARNLFVNDAYPPKKDGIDRAYYGNLVLLANHYVALFDLLSGRKYNEEHFREYCISQGYWVDEKIIPEKIQDRRILWEVYRKAINRGMDFFIESASLAQIGEHKRVYIKEGLHRAMFLAYLGLDFVPVRVKKEDYYSKFHIGSESMERIDAAFRNGQKMYLTNPILNERYETGKSSIRVIYQYIFEEVRRDRDCFRNLVEYDDYHSSFARLLSKCYSYEESNIASVEESDEGYALAEICNTIDGTDNVTILRSATQFEGKCNALLLLNNMKINTCESLVQIVSAFQPQIVIKEIEPNAIEMTRGALSGYEFGIMGNHVGERSSNCLCIYRRV